MVKNYSGLRLISMVCSDHKSHFEIIYYFDKDKEVLPVATKISRKKPSAHSISDIFKIAETYEREIYEQFGVRFVGNSKLKKKLLLADRPDKKYPLRRKK